LKKQIIDRLAKKYGFRNTELITGKVNTYIDNGNAISATGLQKLED
jgi:hypothetical protein